MPTCTFCDNDAVAMTPGGDWVCESCGDEILDAHYSKEGRERPD